MADSALKVGNLAVGVHADGSLVVSSLFLFLFFYKFSSFLFI